MIQNLGHEYVEVRFSQNDINYSVYFNANTKELISIGLWKQKDYSYGKKSVKELLDDYEKMKEKTKQFDPNQYEEIATKYLVEYKIGGLEKAQFVKGAMYAGSNEVLAFLLYQDEKKADQKVIIIVNPETKKVQGFYLKTMADSVARGSIFNTKK